MPRQTRTMFLFCSQERKRPRSPESRPLETPTTPNGASGCDAAGARSGLAGKRAVTTRAPWTWPHSSVRGDGASLLLDWRVVFVARTAGASMSKSCSMYLASPSRSGSHRTNLSAARDMRRRGTSPTYTPVGTCSVPGTTWPADTRPPDVIRITEVPQEWRDNAHQPWRILFPELEWPERDL